jgi:hypothetical protein
VVHSTRIKRLRAGQGPTARLRVLQQHHAAVAVEHVARPHGGRVQRHGGAVQVAQRQLRRVAGAKEQAARARLPRRLSRGAWTRARLPATRAPAQAPLTQRMDTRARLPAAPAPPPGCRSGASGAAPARRASPALWRVLAEAAAGGIEVFGASGATAGRGLCMPPGETLCKSGPARVRCSRCGRGEARPLQQGAAQQCGARGSSGRGGPRL